MSASREIGVNFRRHTVELHRVQPTADFHNLFAARRTIAPIFGALFFLFCSVYSAKANSTTCVVPDPVATVNVQAVTTNSSGEFVGIAGGSTGFGSFGVTGTVSHANADVEASPMVVVVAGGTTSAKGAATLTYNFELCGPGSVTAPIDLSNPNLLAVANGGSSDDDRAFASLGVSFGSTALLDMENANCSLSEIFCPGLLCVKGCAPGTVSPNQLMIPSNVLITVTEGAAAGIEGTGSSIAEVDPVFSIDPSFAGLSQYSLVFSPGILNAPLATTPEPSSLILILFGLIAAGTMTIRARHCKLTTRQSDCPLTGLAQG